MGAKSSKSCVKAAAEPLPMPLVDLSKTVEEAAAALRQACEEHGFFVVVNHGIPEDLIKKMFAQNKAFFALPEEKKMLLLSDKKSRGYSPLGEQKLDPQNQPQQGDTKESIYIWGEKTSPPAGHPDCDLPLHGPNQWPEGPEFGIPDFKPVMQEYLTAMEGLLHRVNVVLALSLDLPRDYFAPKFDRALLTLRPIHYTADVAKPGEGVFSAGAHTDWGHLTFLVTDGTPGLQLHYKGKWVDVPHLPGAFQCNIGDLTQRWTNRRYRSTRHRVVNTTGRERYSCAFFTSPNYDTLVECLPTCTGATGPLFPPTTTHEHLGSKYAETHAQFAAHNPGMHPSPNGSGAPEPREEGRKPPCPPS